MIADDAAANAVLKTLLDVVKDRYEESRERLRAEMEASGVERVSAQVAGEKVAQIVLTERKASIGLDNKAFHDWVEQTHPGEIVTAEPTVRSSFRTAMLDRLAIVGDVVVDSKTGETVEWAHVVPAAQKYTTTKLLAGGQDAILRAWRAGEISLDALAVPEIKAK